MPMNSDSFFSDEIKDTITNTTNKGVKIPNMSDKNLPIFLQKSKSISIKSDIESKIEETKNKIVKNLDNIKLFKIYNKDELAEEAEYKNFHIHHFINERKKIRNKILSYSKNLDSDVMRFIECLCIDPTKRTKIENNYIKQYLMKTSLMQSLFNLDENKRNISKIINKVCLNLKHKFLHAGKTIYEINSVPDSYYYIIKGRVRALKPEKIATRMTGFEYFTHIMKLKKDNENYLIDIILKSQTNLIIHKKDLPILNYIFFVIIFKEYYTNINYRFYFKYELEGNQDDSDDSHLEKMISLCFCDKEEILKDIDYDKKQKEHDLSMKELEKKIRKNIPEFPEYLLKNYHQMAVGRKIYDLILFKYKSVVDLKKGSFFGESTKKNSLRNYTFKTVEDCHLSYLEIEIYDTFLKKEKEKITGRMINYLHNKFFFNHINEYEFVDQFFSSFVFEVKDLGYKLTDQNAKLDYIYFIKDGEISVNCDLSINIFAKNILSPLKEQSIFRSNEKFLKLINELESFLKKNKINFNIPNITSLFIAASTSIIGLDSYFFNFDNYLYDSFVSSSRVKYFKIEKKYLSRIFEQYSYIKEVAQSEAIQKILLMIERFIKTLKMKIEKENNSNLDKMKNINSINSNSNRVKLNFEVNNSKIIDFENDEKNSNIYFDENSSINHSRKLNKYIIKDKILKDKKNNKSELLNNKNTSFDKKKIKYLYNIYEDNRIFRNLKNAREHSSIVSIFNQKFNPISIKNEKILVTLLQKNIENNLFFSKSINKNKSSASNLKINQIYYDNNSTKNTKYNNSNYTKKLSLTNSDEDNINLFDKSHRKSFRSVHTNTIETMDNKNNINNQYNNFNRDEDRMISTNIFNFLNTNKNSRNKFKVNTLSKNKSENILSKNSLSPINKNIQKYKINYDSKYFSFDNDINNYKLNKNIPLANKNKSKIDLNDNTKIRIQISKNFLFNKKKKSRYSFLKNQILHENY